MWNWHSLTNCTQNNLSRSPAKLCQTTSCTAAVWNHSCCPSDSLQAAAVIGTVWFHMVYGWKMFTVEPPFISQNDRVYAPVDNTKRHQSQPTATHVGMASIAVSPVGMTEVIFVNHEVKVNGQHYCDVLLSQQMLSAIKRVAERCLFTKQYVAYSEIGHFLCSVISQGKVVALYRWGGKWNHHSMTHRLATNYAKNYCNRTLTVKVIVENVVTCFLRTQCILRFVSERRAITLDGLKSWRRYISDQIRIVYMDH